MVVRSESPDAAFYLLPVPLFGSCLSWFTKSEEEPILDRFIEEEKLLEIKQRRSGDRCDAEGELSYSTVSSYLSVIKQVRVKWGKTHITRMKPLAVQEWLKQMDTAPKTKGHVKAIMHRLYE